MKRRKIREVSRHERRHDEIEGLGRKRERPRVSAIKRARLSPERLNIAVDWSSPIRVRDAFVRQEAKVPAGAGADVERPVDRKRLPERLHRRLLDSHERVVGAGRVGLGPESVALVRLEKRNHQNPVVSGRWYCMRRWRTRSS